MSTVALLVITDRPAYLERTLLSAAANLPGFDQYIEVEDQEHRLEFAGAIREGWREVDCDYVFHLEDDFVFHEPVPVAEMVALLERRPELAQVSLKRQAWSPEECAAGGIVECHPGDFDEVSDDRATWTEHRSYFTTTPSVYSARLCELGWPQCPHSEGIFTHRLLEDPALRFAIWGSKFDAPRCEHIGEVRAGCGY
jgi:hypothetical protein